jgi:hypothetical protein
LKAKLRSSAPLTVLGALAHSCIYGIVAKLSDMFAVLGIHKVAKVSVDLNCSSVLIHQVAGPGSSQLKDILAHARLCGCMESMLQCAAM